MDASAERLSPVIQRYAFDAHRRVALMFGVRMAKIGMLMVGGFDERRGISGFGGGARA